MMHNEGNGNKRVFFVNGQQAVVDFAKEAKDALSPCVLFDFTVEGTIDGGRVTRNYPLYFMVKAEPLNGTASGMSDGEAAAVALEWAWTHTKAFLAWLQQQVYEHRFNEDYSMIDLKDNIYINTAGPLQNGWWGVVLQLERNESRRLCVNEGDYIVDCECDE